MNYARYEAVIVEKHGIALTGWPFTGPIRNPGALDSTDIITLKHALHEKRCKWIILTEEQRAARKASNAERVADGGHRSSLENQGTIP